MAPPKPAAPRRAAIALPLLLCFGCAAPSSQAPLPMPTAARPCPQWTDLPTDPHSNIDSPYLGCTNAANLRAMLANPADLDHGRPLGPADGGRAAQAVSDYRAGKVKSGAGAGAIAPSIVLPGAGAPP